MLRGGSVPQALCVRAEGMASQLAVFQNTHCPPAPQLPKKLQSEIGLHFSPVKISSYESWDEGISSDPRNSTESTHFPMGCHFSAQGPWVGRATWEGGQTQAPQGPVCCPPKTELETGCPQEATPERNAGQEILYTQKCRGQRQSLLHQHLGTSIF